MLIVGHSQRRLHFQFVASILKAGILNRSPAPGNKTYNITLVVSSAF